MPVVTALCGENVTVLDSNIMLTPSTVDFRQDFAIRTSYLSISRSHLGATKKADLRVVTEDVLAVATSTFTNITLLVHGNASIVASNMTGKYKLDTEYPESK